MHSATEIFDQKWNGKLTATFQECLQYCTLKRRRYTDLGYWKTDGSGQVAFWHCAIRKKIFVMDSHREVSKKNKKSLKSSKHILI